MADDFPIPVAFLLLVGCMFGGFIALIVWSTARDRQRISALRDWARRREYSYAERDGSLGRLYGALPFENGGRVTFSNVIRGRLAGLPLTAFDYTYTARTSNHDSTGSSTENHHRRVVALDLPGGWPAVTAEPDLLGGRIATALGAQDLSIGHPAFDRRYRVKSQNEATARLALRPLADALMARPDQTLHLEGTLLLLYRHGVHAPEDLQGWLAELAAALTAGEFSSPKP